MYLKEVINNIDSANIKIFVDMDGVIADYDIVPLNDYLQKRPLFDSINKLKEISNMPNVEMYILSVSVYEENVKNKNIWLDKYAPFFKKENRIIIFKDNNIANSLKLDYLKRLDKNESVIVLIDDDPRVLNEVRKELSDIILLKDSVLID